ncbi:MAG: protoporphyrinogen oxidase, partial [Xanthomonadales bacterium]|nr:protoporphyrinogen oxidase [Xanthomonadales bacterium]
RMSLASCFPRINELELQYGSLIRALVSLQFKAHREGRKKLPGAGPGGTLTSFGEGISELIERLEAVLAGSIRKNTPVAGVSMQNGDYQLQLENGTTEDFHALIMAVPAWVQSQLLDQLSPAISRTLSRVYYPPLSVVCLGYDEADIPPSLNGFGFLVPSTERKHILGAVIDSNVFPNRAPAGRALIRVMAGGSRAPGIAMREDSSLVDLVKGDLEAMTGIAAEPEFCRVYRHMRAIPQYHVGHGHLIDELADSLVAFPGLYLAGNAFKGVSLNDCVANAFRIADQITNGAK